MKFKQLIYIVLACIVSIAIAGSFALRSLYNEKPVGETRTVYVQKTESGFQLVRNGEPFVIRGAGGSSHFKELAEIGGNTVRLFNTADLRYKLDEAHKHGLAVIVDIYVPYYSTKYDLYEDEVENLILKQEIRDLVHEYKEHPALLIWNLGNEIRYPFVLRKNKFIRIFNELISIVKETDPDHPVSTSIIGVSRRKMSSIFFHSPELDIISFNIFGNTKFARKHLTQISFLFGPRPYFFSELGPDGPWESSTTAWGAPVEATSTIKAERIRTRFNMVNDIEGGNLGSLMFYWGIKLERTHTWFSLFKNGGKSEIINVIETMWQQAADSRKSGRKDYMFANGAHGGLSSTDESSYSNFLPGLIGLNYMLVNNRGYSNNIVLYPGELSHAEVFFHENNNEIARVEWEIYPEAWYCDTSKIVVDNYKPVGTFVDSEANKATFLAPAKEGPYRIFVYVYNKDGFFATTNTPFYVLRNK